MVFCHQPRRTKYRVGINESTASACLHHPAARGLRRSEARRTTLNNPRRIAAVFTATITLFFGCSRSAEIPIEIPFTPVLSGLNVSCQVAPSGFSLHDLR